MAIRRYHASRGDAQRTVCLIPKSAHGTNPATAQMMGMQVVVVACDDNGNVDVADLKAKAEQYSATLACLMITYPSTHGVFEEGHARHLRHHPRPRRPGVYGRRQPQRPGGLVQPGKIGADVSHMNLHKTFCIPHGGGGPGMGPIGLKAHLARSWPTTAWRRYRQWQRRPERGVGRAVWQRVDFADFHVHPA